MQEPALQAVVKMTTVIGVLAISMTLIEGCGGALGGGTITTSSVLPVPGSYLTSLCSLEPATSCNWVTPPTVGKITINGHEYDPALKAAVDGDHVRTGSVRYHLGGRFSALGMVFGVTADEPDSPSWTAFRFWGDGREVAVPHYVKKGERRVVIVNVRGLSDFDLIAEGIPQTDGRSYGSTQIGWGYPTLLEEGGVKYLADLQPTRSTGWSAQSNDADIWIGLRPYPHGLLGTIARAGQGWASRTYELDGEYKTLVAVAGIDCNDQDPGARAEFEVVADGNMLADYVVPISDTKIIQLPVTGTHRLELRTRVAQGTTESFVKIGWGMALLLKDGGPNVNASQSGLTGKMITEGLLQGRAIREDVQKRPKP